MAKQAKFRYGDERGWVEWEGGNNEALDLYLDRLVDWRGSIPNEPEIVARLPRVGQVFAPAYLRAVVSLTANWPDDERITDNMCRADTSNYSTSCLWQRLKHMVRRQDGLQTGSCQRVLTAYKNRVGNDAKDDKKPKTLGEAALIFMTVLHENDALILDDTEERWVTQVWEPAMNFHGWTRKQLHMSVHNLPESFKAMAKREGLMAAVISFANLSIRDNPVPCPNTEKKDGDVPKKPHQQVQGAVNTPSNKTNNGGGKPKPKADKDETKKAETVVPLKRCYRCNKRGHTKQDCTNPPYCYRCKKTGHIGPECPEEAKES